MEGFRQGHIGQMCVLSNLSNGSVGMVRLEAEASEESVCLRPGER